MDENSFIVDRIEENIIVLENNNGDIIKVGLSFIDEKPSEGDILVKIGNNFKVDKVATLNRKKYINKLMRGMWEDE